MMLEFITLETPTTEVIYSQDRSLLKRIKMDFLDHILETLPDFDLSRCDRIVTIKLFEENGRLMIDCVIQSDPSHLVELRFYDSWNVHLRLSGGPMHIYELIITRLEEAVGFAVGDTLLGSSWFCRDIIVLGINTLS